MVVPQIIQWIAAAVFQPRRSREVQHTSLPVETVRLLAS
jgi:hypothetical protein